MDSIKVFDPILSLVDIKVLESYHIHILSVNEKAARKVYKPTLFYMPHCGASLYSNVIGINATMTSKIEPSIRAPSNATITNMSAAPITTADASATSANATVSVENSNEDTDSSEFPLKLFTLDNVYIIGNSFCAYETL